VSRCLARKTGEDTCVSVSLSVSRCCGVKSRGNPRVCVSTPVSRCLSLFSPKNLGVLLCQRENSESQLVTTEISELLEETRRDSVCHGVCRRFDAVLAQNRRCHRVDSCVLLSFVSHPGIASKTSKKQLATTKTSKKQLVTPVVASKIGLCIQNLVNPASHYLNLEDSASHYENWIQNTVLDTNQCLGSKTGGFSGEYTVLDTKQPLGYKDRGYSA